MLYNGVRKILNLMGKLSKPKGPLDGAAQVAIMPGITLIVMSCCSSSVYFPGGITAVGGDIIQAAAWAWFS